MLLISFSPSFVKVMNFLDHQNIASIASKILLACLGGVFVGARKETNIRFCAAETQEEWRGRIK